VTPYKPRTSPLDMPDWAFKAAQERATETLDREPTLEEICDAHEDLEDEWDSADDEIYPEVCA
jgi:hypothetical protein